MLVCTRFGAVYGSARRCIVCAMDIGRKTAPECDLLRRAFDAMDCAGKFGELFIGRMQMETPAQASQIDRLCAARFARIFERLLARRWIGLWIRDARRKDEVAQVMAWRRLWHDQMARNWAR